jgi:hypothetical protein
MDRRAMNRSETWRRQQAERQARELQAMVWPNGAPRRSAASALYPRHPSSSRDAAPAQHATKPAATTAASRIWPRLKRG